MVGGPRYQGFAKRFNEALDDIHVRPGRGRPDEVRKMFKVSRETARKWLSGLAMPSEDRRDEFKSKLTVRLAWLFFDEGQKGDEFTPEETAYLRKMQMLSPTAQVGIKTVIDAFPQPLTYPECGERRKVG